MKNEKLTEDIRNHHDAEIILEQQEEIKGLEDKMFVRVAGLQAGIMALDLIEHGLSEMESTYEGGELRSDPIYQFKLNCKEIMNRLIEILKEELRKGHIAKQHSGHTSDHLITSDQTEEWNSRHHPSAMLKRYADFEKMDDFPFLMELGLQGINSELERVEQEIMEMEHLNQGRDLGSDPVCQVCINWAKSMRRVKRILKEAREGGASGFIFPSDITPA